jgi:ubiquinone/menaquinone biosynthesis C-methylase UbiE
MSHPLSRLVTRLSYAATQLPRIAWYVGHGIAMRRLSEEVGSGNRGITRAGAHTNAPIPDRGRLLSDIWDLLRRDVANVEAGIYPLPADRDGPLGALLTRSRLFFEDLPEVHRRRESDGRREVLSREIEGRRPSYYLQNFHFQSGGWLTDESAQRYDTQVEVLFNGMANVIPRQALLPLHEIFAGRDQRGLKVMDVGCGTGRFINFLKQVWPRLPTLGVDLSEAYLREAKRHLRRYSRVECIVAKAEALPVPDESQDAVTSLFVFHELPPPVRRTAFQEFSRVLKPGGRLIIVDSLQYGDEPDYDGLLEIFPQNFHEPYYRGYLKEDFASIAADSGLRHTKDVNVFVSKMMTFEKLV